MEELLYSLGATAAVALLGMQLFKTFVAKGAAASHADRAKHAEEVDRLREELRAELEAMREDHAAALEELYSRVDFAERLLIQGRQLESQEEKEPTPV